jgi:hypothetical protein
MINLTFLSTSLKGRPMAAPAGETCYSNVNLMKISFQSEENTLKLAAAG